MGLRDESNTGEFYEHPAMPAIPVRSPHGRLSENVAVRAYSTVLRLVLVQLPIDIILDASHMPVGPQEVDMLQVATIEFTFIGIIAVRALSSKSDDAAFRIFASADES
jgi:hypothetical protein